MTMTTEEITSGFATALSKLFGPGVLCELLGDCMNAPPKEPTVMRVGILFDDSTHMLHSDTGKVEDLCYTVRIRGSCRICGCGSVIWDDR